MRSSTISAIILTVFFLLTSQAQTEERLYRLRITEVSPLGDRHGYAIQLRDDRARLKIIVRMAPTPDELLLSDDGVRAANQRLQDAPLMLDLGRMGAGESAFRQETGRLLDQVRPALALLIETGRLGELSIIEIEAQ